MEPSGFFCRFFFFFFSTIIVLSGACAIFSPFADAREREYRSLGRACANVTRDGRLLRAGEWSAGIFPADRPVLQRKRVAAKRRDVLEDNRLEMES